MGPVHRAQQDILHKWDRSQENTEVRNGQERSGTTRTGQERPGDAPRGQDGTLPRKDAHSYVTDDTLPGKYAHFYVTDGTLPRKYAHSYVTDGTLPDNAGLGAQPLYFTMFWVVLGRK